MAKLGSFVKFRKCWEFSKYLKFDVIALRCGWNNYLKLRFLVNFFFISWNHMNLPRFKLIWFKSIISCFNSSWRWLKVTNLLEMLINFLHFNSFLTSKNRLFPKLIPRSLRGPDFTFWQSFRRGILKAPEDTTLNSQNIV